MAATFEIGNAVQLTGTEREGSVGVVSKSIAQGVVGHVLTVDDGCLIGVPATVEDVEPAGDQGGFAQLAHALIELGSHIIEERLLIP